MMKVISPTVVISLDFELAWGSFDKAYSKELLDCARWTHDYGVPAILSHLSRTRLSATWATVGCVMLRELPPIDDLMEVKYPHFDKPWFTFVPRNTGELDAREWFGASVVERIRQTTPAQELAFHSFSHVIFGEPGTPPERARQEFDRCAAIAKDLGFPAHSFVFPRNSIGYLDLLRQAGFTCYRSRDPVRFASMPIPKARALASVMADFLALTPPAVYPSIEGGLVNIPGSLMVRYVKGWRRFIPDTCRIRRLLSGLDRVCANGGVFHVWLHPENLYFGRPRLESVLERFFTAVRDRMEQCKIRCLTMGQLAQEVLRP